MAIELVWSRGLGRVVLKKPEGLLEGGVVVGVEGVD